MSSRIESPGSFSKTRSLIFPTFIVILLVSFGFCVLAQCQDVSDVHVYPRMSARKPDMLPAIPGKIFQAAVDLVLVPVTVTDSMDRLVTGLAKDNFNIFQDKKKQSIQNLSNDDAPISAGIILDVSGSMKNKIENSRAALMEFLKLGKPQDEFFLITFSDRPQLACDFTNRLADIQNKLIFVQPNGRTALLDAIYLGLNEMRHARNPRKALLIISDGGDNHSRYTESEVKSAVEEADVQVFAIGLFDESPSTTEEQMGPDLLDEITNVTGGRTFTVSNPNDLTDVAAKIGLSLRDEYVIAYQPTVKPHDGKWHKIKVKLLPPRGLPPLHVLARTGYYAPAE
jgi:Ca-activated chloride channel homolog